MVIKKTVTAAYSIDVIDAYRRVEAVEPQGKTEIRYCVRSYKDASSLSTALPAL